MKIRPILAVLLFTLSSHFATAAPTQCPQHYLGGQAPDFLNAELAQKTREICYKGYGLIHSSVTRTPLISAEHLTRGELSKERPPRINAFHPDPNINSAERAELFDYQRSGFDRGHMAPSGDMFDEAAQYESFSLANIIPQDHDNNTALWEGIESATRYLAKRSGELYVITGPIFYGAKLKRLNGRVLVPTYIYKAIYDPHKKQAGAYLVANEPGGRYAVISIAELDRLSGISVFPAMPHEAKQTPMALPQPRPKNKIKVSEDKTIVPALPQR